MAYTFCPFCTRIIIEEKVYDRLNQIEYVESWKLENNSYLILNYDLINIKCMNWNYVGNSSSHAGLPPCLVGMPMAGDIGCYEYNLEL